MEPASRHRDPRLTAQPPTAFSGRARGSLAGDRFLLGYLVGGICIGVAILLAAYALWIGV